MFVDHGEKNSNARQNAKTPKFDMERLSAVSGASTYPANRDFEGSRWGVRGTAPQIFFIFLFFFPKKFIDFQEEECDILTKT